MDKTYVNINCLLITSIIRETIILTSKKNTFQVPNVYFSPSVLYNHFVCISFRMIVFHMC